MFLFFDNFLDVDVLNHEDCKINNKLYILLSYIILNQESEYCKVNNKMG